MNTNGPLIERLARSNMYQQFECAYTEATGMPVALRPVETWQLPLHGKPKENPFCALIAGTSRSCAACLQVQQKLVQSAANEPATITCRYGLCETAVPLKFGPQTVGFLQTGQVMLQKPTEAAFNRAVGQAAKLGVDINHPQEREAYFQTPVVSDKKLESSSRLLSIFADHLSMKGNQLALLEGSAEPAMIIKVRKFIDGHYMENLSLACISKAVNASLFHFCKVFRKTAGITFTEFVSRTRVEKGKQLLLNQNLRVSEIAYEIGFRSLTHFNRMFKRVTGESPTQYRVHLRSVHGPTLGAARKRLPHSRCFLGTQPSLPVPTRFLPSVQITPAPPKPP